MIEPAISVLTPTYNRAHVLHRVYDSLNRQKVRDFEWVVVDDGSTDDTPMVLARWQTEANFPITWCRYSNNRGKQAALNLGRTLVSGEYTLVLDSDDAFVDDAMETIAAWRNKTNVDSKNGICGLAFRCVDKSGNIVGTLRNGKQNFPEESMTISTRAARYGLGINFDYTIVYKTKIFPEMDYGELDGSENLPPSIGVNRVSDSYDVIYIDRAIRVFYRQDGVARLSDKPARQVKWPRGNYLRVLAILNEDIDWFWQRPKIFLSAARKVTRLGLHIGRPLSYRFRDLNNKRARWLWVVSIPGGLFGYVRDRLNGRIAPKALSDISAWGPASPPENPMLHLPPARFHMEGVRKKSLHKWIANGRNID